MNSVTTLLNAKIEERYSSIFSSKSYFALAIDEIKSNVTNTVNTLSHEVILLNNPYSVLDIILVKIGVEITARPFPKTLLIMYHNAILAVEAPAFFCFNNVIPFTPSYYSSLTH